MKIARLPKGCYVVAVSGGVDSVVLLDLLRQQPQLELIVAHFNHGIRTDAEADELLVSKLATDYNLPFVSERGQLGPDASEATARGARYRFLYHIKESNSAQAIITAHHEDDMLETAVINVLRGTGRRGLSALGSDDELIRPMLHIHKQAIYDYAKKQKLIWHEDSTNQDEKYLRNYVRQSILAKFSPEQRDQLLEIVQKARQLNAAIDEILHKDFHIDVNADAISRHWFIMLSHSVAKEFMLSWLRKQNVTLQLDRKTLEYLVQQAKTLSPGQEITVNKDWKISISKEGLALARRDR
ncbi:tRNA lysidine(34) synthetase TilS [Candidatus Saccharibacteria bacterium]|nr:tRNA lysidine(34) synthetase TilS [Candidatus Saccharibacteria bacterium]